MRPATSDQHFKERGFDFAFAALVFAGPYLEFDDTRRDDGERRIAALGLADGIPLPAVVTDRLTPAGAVVRRLIGARLSNSEERRRTAESLQAIRLEDDRAYARGRAVGTDAGPPRGAGRGSSGRA